jgi:malate dehydrogenase (oxaloacetate-decarboxylating)
MTLSVFYFYSAILLLNIGVKEIIICDTKGAIYTGRPVNMNKQKDELAAITNPHSVKGSL